MTRGWIAVAATVVFFTACVTVAILIDVGVL